MVCGDAKDAMGQEQGGGEGNVEQGAEGTGREEWDRISRRGIQEA